MALISDILKGAGDFAQGAAQAVPGTVKRANDFAIQAQNVAVREKANQLQQQNIEGLNKNREQQREFQNIQLTMKAMTSPNKALQKFVIDRQVKDGNMSKDFGDMVMKTSDDARLEFQKRFGDGKISMDDLVFAKQQNMETLIPMFTELENAKSARGLQSAQTAKARSESKALDAMSKSLQQTANTLNQGVGTEPQTKPFVQGTGEFLQGAGISKPNLPPIAAGTQAFLDKADGVIGRLDKLIADNIGGDTFSKVDTAVTGQPVGTSAEQIDAQVNAEQEARNPGVLVNDATGMTDDEILSFVAMEDKATERKKKAAQLDKEFNVLDAKYKALLGQTNKVATAKTKDVLARMRIIETQRGRLLKGYPSAISTSLADFKTVLAQIQRIEKGFDPSFTGPIEGKELKFPPFFGPDTGLKASKFRIKKRSSKELGFRADVGVLKTQMRKALFGAAQTKIELEGSLDSIPDFIQLDAKFIAALASVKRDVMSNILALTEAGENSRTGGIPATGGTTGGQ